MLFPLLRRVVLKYAPYLPLPVAAVIGFVGYKLEGWISTKYTPGTESVKERREDRLLEKMETSTDNKKHKPLEFNLSPSLSNQ